MTDTTGALGATEEWRLRDEREFLVRSLADAEREHAAGDLTDADYALLHRRDEQRLAEVDTILAAAAAATTAEPAAAEAVDVETVTPGPARPGQRPAPRARPAPDRRSAAAWPAGLADDTGDDGDDGGDGGDDGHDDGGVEAGSATRPARRRGPRRRRLWLAVLGVAFVIAGAVCLVLDVTAPRQTGQVSSGSTTEGPAVPRNEVRQQLAQAAIAAADGTDTKALTLYGDVISEEPDNANALAAWGWLDWRAALNTAKVTATVAAEGQSAVVRAVALDEKLYPAQYYLGDIYYQEHEYRKAVTHLAAFLALHPPQTWLDEAAPVIRSAYLMDKQPIPAGVPMTTGSTATTTSTTSPTAPASAG